MQNSDQVLYTGEIVTVQAIHHVSVVVADTATALAFYRDILGLEVSEARPDLGYAGAWLTIGGGQIHLLELPNPDAVDGRPAHVGRDRHLALAVSELSEISRTLDRHEIPYTRSRSGREAIFCRDPDGNGVELIEVSPGG
ncbi:MAG: VOC family protein [Pseudomonadota bacterium]|nr:VOC family protein [Pseudomonadota bacterium]